MTYSSLFPQKPQLKIFNWKGHLNYFEETFIPKPLLSQDILESEEPSIYMFFSSSRQAWRRLPPDFWYLTVGRKKKQLPGSDEMYIFFVWSWGCQTEKSGRSVDFTNSSTELIKGAILQICKPAKIARINTLKPQYLCQDKWKIPPSWIIFP